MENIKSPTPAILLSSEYDKNLKKIMLKLYEPESKKIIKYYDNTNYKPYFYSKLEIPELEFITKYNDIVCIQNEMKYDLLEDKEIRVSKIIMNEPFGFESPTNSIKYELEMFEDNVKIHESYLYDKSLIIGKWYSIENNKLIEYNKIDKKITESLKNIKQNENVLHPENFNKETNMWVELLNQPTTNIKRMGIDIEVDVIDLGKMADTQKADRKITAISFSGTDIKKVFVLNTEKEKGTNDLPGDVTVKFYTSEKQMITDAFDIISDYPIILTYNGDLFDMPYLHNRAVLLGVENNQIQLLFKSASLKNGIHIDIYKITSNPPYQIYIFNAKYSSFSLNSVAKAILNEKKIDYNIPINKLNLYQIANYCYNDSRLTYNLTTYDDSVLMNILLIIARIGNVSINEVSRNGISQLIKSMHYFRHREINALIPRIGDLENRQIGVKSNAVIKNKKYRGAIVVKPKPGVHFDVTVLDFASLYPSIIKINNLSYETIRCIHTECKENRIEYTNHWACKRKNGMTSLIIGSLRDLRVNYYKHLSKDKSIDKNQRTLYTVISQSLKVILNATYGVMGSESFQLYFLPVAECTSASGRYIIANTIKYCKTNGIKVLYGDTDSVFMKTPKEVQLNNLIETIKQKYNIDIEVDKVYRYIALSNRKKNYFGVLDSGKVDIKGLTGKKSHTPIFIKNVFYEMVKTLSTVYNMNDFKESKKKINEIIQQCVVSLRDGKFELDELSFNIMLKKNLTEYIKTTPQHIKAARLLSRTVEKGEIISYIKTTGKINAKPVEIVKKSDIDIKKYEEFIEKTFSQMTSPMGLDYDIIFGRQKQLLLTQYC